MIANVSAHRRANAFAQALEQLSDRDSAAEQPEGPAPDAAPEPAQAPAARADHQADHRAEQTEPNRLVAIATGLGELPKPVLDPAVKVVHRAQLVAAMEAMLRDGTVPGGRATDPLVPEQRSRAKGGTHRASGLGKLRPRTRLTKGLAAGGLSVGVAAGAFGGVAAASSDALPGDSLYGLKRGIEDIKLNYLTDGAGERGQVYLDQASTRLNEARRLMERDRAGQLDHESLGEIRRALSGMRHDVSEGHRLLHEAYRHDPDSLGPIQALDAFSRSHREAWGALRDRLPVQLGDVSQEVSSVFDAIDQEVAPLQSLLPKPPSGNGGSGAGGGNQRQGSGPGSSTSSSGSDRSAAPSNTGGDSTDGRESSSGKPKPSASGAGNDGLLGGNTGGLLDPPAENGTASPSTTTPSDTEPDVTLPPLLPGLLPGLGIDSEDAS
ncbi:DUF5667 domain-containing protein [Streptomyces turgidiscabies]|uniref:DUF5667 domain-containing protein n=1 Tax=Streptomyces turgidiscabies (strain Car8) TaxID=698760 RepID=L7FA75_STRT8|nr:MULTISPECIES: DUF5667 domain-containing protein [Streptomyces]ELP67966.1 hypothetical protein STRTUCAR8_04816 [Streptomyces turgidiscabies Car8]MDX3498795.1 DUF5667 domain-containing protein [Streptomyces turgidiscabies]GAQ74777.1 hypothetical protein T45_06557 [Streptomyces turgidiscabies]